MTAPTTSTGGCGVRALLIASGFALVVGIGVLVVSLGVLHRFYLPSESMEPTIPKSSIIWTVPVSGADVKPYDIIVHARPPAAPSSFQQPGDLLVVKRVVAVAGDTVEFVDGHLLVNGQRTREDFLAPGQQTLAGAEELGRRGPGTVPASTVYALGDNRTNSLDSRYLGPIPFEQIRDRQVATTPAGSSTIIVLGGIALTLVGAVLLVVGLVLRSSRRHDRTAPAPDGPMGAPGAPVPPVAPPP